MSKTEIHIREWNERLCERINIRYATKPAKKETLLRQLDAHTLLALEVVQAAERREAKFHGRTTLGDVWR